MNFTDNSNTLYLFNTGQVTNPILDKNPFDFTDNQSRFINRSIKLAILSRKVQIYGFVTNYPVRSTFGTLQIKQYNSDRISFAIMGYSIMMLKKFLINNTMPDYKIKSVVYKLPETLELSSVELAIIKQLTKEVKILKILGEHKTPCLD